MATNSLIFTGLALPISHSASLQQASPSSFNSVCTAKKSMTTSFLNPGSGLGTLKVNNARVAASYQSRRGRHRRLLVRANLFDDFVKSFTDATSSLLESMEKFAEEKGFELDPDPRMDDEFIFIQRRLEQTVRLQEHYESEYKAAHQISEQWYENARVFLGKGEEDLARVALRRWITYGDDAKQLKHRFEGTRKFGRTLLLLVKPMKRDMRRAAAKKQRQAARTGTKVSEMSGNGKTNWIFSAFEHVEEKEASIMTLKPDELDKKYALESTPLDDDHAIAIFKKELAAAPTTEKDDKPYRWWSPFNNFEVEIQIKVLRQEMEEEK